MRFFSKLLPAIKSKLVISIVGIVLFLAFGGFFTYSVTKAEVTVTNDGEDNTIYTHADTVAELLQDLGIKAQAHDELSHKKDTRITSGMKIDYNKAKKIVLTMDDEEKDYFTTADTIGEFFKEENIDINEHDEVSHEEKSSIENGMNLQVNKAFEVTLNDGGEKETVWTTGGTVESFLQTHDIELGELDKLKPDKTDQVEKDDAITITRVEKVTDVKKETKEYEVVTEEDGSLEKGKENVVSAGEEGVIEKHFEVTLENGEEVHRELINEEVKKKSEQRVVAVGTKTASTTSTDTSTNSNSKEAETVSRNDDENAEELYMNATAFSADCSGCSGVTATGIDLNNNPNKKVVAVDPSVIPLGSRVWVEGYGHAVAGDTGGSISGNRIDLHVPTSSEASSFGSKKVRVKVLD